MQSLSSEFDLHENELVGEWFRMKTRLTERKKATWKWPIMRRLYFSIAGY